MRQQKSGKILNVSSQGGLMGFTGSSAYCSAKVAAFVCEMTERGNLPQRLLIGAKCCEQVKADLEAQLVEIESYRELASQTDF